MSNSLKGVLIDHRPLQLINQTAGASGFRHEVGGILLGSYRGDHLHIVDITTPQRLDRWSPVRFWRSPAGHQELADTAWRRSGGTVTYMCEWHSHAEPIPRPSVIDRASWRSTVRAQCRPLLFFIQGTDQTWLSLASGLGEFRRVALIDEDAEGFFFGPLNSREPPPSPVGARSQSTWLR